MIHSLTDVLDKLTDLVETCNPRYEAEQLDSRNDRDV